VLVSIEKAPSGFSQLGIIKEYIQYLPRMLVQNGRIEAPRLRFVHDLVAISSEQRDVLLIELQCRIRNVPSTERLGNFTLILSFLVSFSDPTGAVFPDDGLPSTPFSLSDFQGGNFAGLGFLPSPFPGLPGTFQNFGGQVTSLTLVPIPAALPLFLSALAVLGFVARRRHRT